MANDFFSLFFLTSAILFLGIGGAWSLVTARRPRSAQCLTKFWWAVTISATAALTIKIVTWIHFRDLLSSAVLTVESITLVHRVLQGQAFLSVSISIYTFSAFATWARARTLSGKGFPFSLPLNAALLCMGFQSLLLPYAFFATQRSHYFPNPTGEACEMLFSYGAAAVPLAVVYVILSLIIAGWGVAAKRRERRSPEFAAEPGLRSGIAGDSAGLPELGWLLALSAAAAAGTVEAERDTVSRARTECRIQMTPRSLPEGPSNIKSLPGGPSQSASQKSLPGGPSQSGSTAG